MAGPAGVSPTIVLSPEGAALAAWLRPGLEIKGRIAENPAGLSFVSGSRTLPLGPQPGLTAGQNVLLQVIRGDAGLQFKLSILPNTANAPVPQLPIPPVLIPVAQDLFQGTVPATVQKDAQGLSLLIQGQRVPLPAGTAFQPGQVVDAKVVMHSGQAFLSLQPASSSTVERLPEIMLAVLKALGATAKPDAARAIPWHAVRENSAAVRQVLSLFVMRQPLGADLQQVAAYVAQGVEAGVLPRGVLDALTQLLDLFGKNEPEALAGALKQWRGSADTQLETRLAQALARGQGDAAVELLRESIRGHLAQARSHDAFTALLRERGQLDPFVAAADRLTDRLAGAALQNLHATDGAYWFMELPFNSEGPLESAQIHVMGDGRNRREVDPSQATIAMDLHLSQIGPLWIQLTFRNGACSCLFRSADSDVLDAVRKQSDELVTGLREAGYPGSAIRTEPWDEDRLAAVAALFKPIGGVNATA
ncbi:MAG: hypothetical protein AMXMBFR84_18310 [Candidatus Hydrogenedentota bacterium]